VASALLRYRDELFSAANPGAEFARDQFAEAAAGGGGGGGEGGARNFVMVELGAGFGKWSRPRPAPPPLSPTPTSAPYSPSHVARIRGCVWKMIPHPAPHRVGGGEGWEWADSAAHPKP
jgi:hypothetical protein